MKQYLALVYKPTLQNILMHPHVAISMDILSIHTHVYICIYSSMLNSHVYRPITQHNTTQQKTIPVHIVEHVFFFSFQVPSFIS